MGFDVAKAGHDKDTLPLSTAEKLWVWAPAGIRCNGHCTDILQLGTAGKLCCWALQEYSALAVSHCRDSVGHCRDALRLGSAGIRCH